MLQVAKNTLGEQFVHTFFSLTQWTTAAEIPAPINYVGWTEHAIVLSALLPQSSPWRFDENQVTQETCYLWTFLMAPWWKI